MKLLNNAKYIHKTMTHRRHTFKTCLSVTSLYTRRYDVTLCTGSSIPVALEQNASNRGSVNKEKPRIWLVGQPNAESVIIGGDYMSLMLLPKVKDEEFV